MPGSGYWYAHPFGLGLAFLTRRSGFPKPSRKRFRERGAVDGFVGTGAPSTDRSPTTYHARLGNGGFKTRNRDARRAKRLLAGSNHRQLAAASLKGQGNAPDSTLRKDRKKKKRRTVTATVCRHFQRPDDSPKCL